MRLKISPAIAAVVLMISAACNNGKVAQADSMRPGVNDTVESLTLRAWAMRDTGAPLDEILAVQALAVNRLREGTSADPAVDVLEQMGFFYYLNADFKNAMRFYEEAVDSLSTMAPSSRPEGAIQLFGDFAALYCELGMHEEALAYSDSAVAESKRQNGRMLSDVYSFRSGIYQAMGDTAAAMHCYDLALKAINDYPTKAPKSYLQGMINGERAYLMLETYAGNRDSVSRAVSLLENALEHNIATDPTAREFSLGYGYSLLGDHERGLQMMENAVAEFDRQGDIWYQRYAIGRLMGEYSRLKMPDRLARLFPLYEQVCDSANAQEKSRYAISAAVRYDAQTKDAHNEALRARLRYEREHSRFVSLVVFVAFVILATATVELVRRYRRLQVKRENQRDEINSLTYIQSQLEERVEVLERDLTVGMNSNRAILAEPKLIVGENEGRFRRAFNVLYPGLIDKLHEDYPALTVNDDLLCMLIYLRHATPEISIFLGISRASVNSARYRLRQKFALSKTEDLDTFITSRLPHLPPHCNALNNSKLD